jgi:hypothetical protein
MAEHDENRLKELVLKGRDEGLSLSEIAAVVGCHVRSVSKIIAATRSAMSGADAHPGDATDLSEALRYEIGRIAAEARAGKPVSAGSILKLKRALDQTDVSATEAAALDEEAVLETHRLIDARILELAEELAIDWAARMVLLIDTGEYRPWSERPK